jgi:hypothetical protein
MCTPHASGGDHEHVPVDTGPVHELQVRPRCQACMPGALDAHPTPHPSPKTLERLPALVVSPTSLVAISPRSPCYPVSYRIVSHTIASRCTAPRLRSHRSRTVRSTGVMLIPDILHLIVWGGPLEQSFDCCIGRHNIESVLVSLFSAKRC